MVRLAINWHSNSPARRAEGAASCHRLICFKYTARDPDSILSRLAQRLLPRPARLHSASLPAIDQLRQLCVPSVEAVFKIGLERSSREKFRHRDSFSQTE